MNDPVMEPFGPLTHEFAPLRNKIMKSLRRAIETGLLEPGTRLVEKDLCQQLNVSRTSLREALRQLQSEGILTDLNNRGLAVVTVTSEDAENIYRIRGVLEPLDRRTVHRECAGCRGRSLESPFSAFEGSLFAWQCRGNRRQQTRFL